ncbi:MAG: hypothetical protein OXT09_28720 [Myxococcales bacterium]|nr:hypothetical protein [Myxococcales bacterium]
MPAARRRAFTLIETALLLCLVGVLLAVAIPTFVRTLRTSKVSEASRQLELMYRHAAAYYAMPQQTESGKRLRCLPEGAGPAPAQPSVEPVEVDFAHAETPGSATWRALEYQPGEPIRYRYTLIPTPAGCGAPSPQGSSETILTLRAEGDLDGDGTMSLFERSASAGDGELSPHPLLVVQDRVE